MPRPRSQLAHDKTLEAAQRLFAERGIDGASMDAIAEESGVSKATIYKHWPDKEALCLEVLSHLHEELPVCESGDVRADIVALLRHLPYRARPDGQPPALIANAALFFEARLHAMRNPAFARAWHLRIGGPRRTRLMTLLQRAIDERQLRPDLNLDVSLALLAGPIMYGQMMSHLAIPMPSDLPERVVEAFWKAHGTQPSPAARTLPRPKRR